MLYACQLGQQIGIVTINPRYKSWFQHQIGKYGLGERVTGVHAMRFQPGSILAASSAHLFAHVLIFVCVVPADVFRSTDL